MLENKLFEIYRRETCSFYLDVALASSKYKCMFREAKKKVQILTSTAN